ncbi:MULTISPECIES: spermidine/putrescine ABC transporter substrate-binding protein PotD [Bacillus cereus group]|uniref:Spermidine/putrescine ABC transporter substrate-binding protein n=1 Tax=Bacillus thuringiensis serovar subtoxicus TaxID=475791 RepID=A0A9X6FKN4_BACTU|nr:MULTISPECIES: spermidine/putrescine ABC transporter substrate-binding protein PotD [Bacillus cereus group]MEB4838643.1 spermidine/putrescine ABC transporter substrate-binding protein PotD [Paenibacillus jamilae]KAA0775497.1 spermidine/putrescine ABC transporter substrate-binding protein [Bacillus sp. TE8-1]MCR6850859.1 spermidine/putrescine ABC transporter substrate-binding protein PotD [Bacillus thuringiensis]MDR4283897.1 spermidine/putrescine ABC transporter substrate-binding protein PotD 
MKLMKRIAGAAIIFSLVAGVLAGCGEKKEELNIYSWADNFDEQVLKDFEKKYNVKINYDKYASNEEMLAKLQAGGAKYDLIQPSDYMVKTMAKMDLLAPLDKKNIPNIENMVSNFKTPAFDPENKYSLVYTWGVTGIAYNKKYVKEAPTSWADLWNEKYKGHVTLLNDSREVLGVGLKKHGFSNSTKDDAQLKTAADDLKKLLPNLLAFDTDNIKQKFITEDAWIGTVWSGDAAFIAKDNKDVEYVVPKEGGTIWADTLAIPKGAKHKELAEKFMNYLLDEKVSVKNYESIGYSNPNEKAHPLHSKEYRDNHMIFLTKEELDRTEWLVDVDDKLKDYDRYWTELKTKGK